MPRARSRRLPDLCALAATLALCAPAHADLWGFIDEAGKAHFATHRVDERYQLFFKGPTSLDAPPPSMPPPAVPPLEGAARLIYQRVTNHPNVERFAPLIEREAKRHNLDPALVRAVVAVESAFEPAAVSPKGAVGLMQVIPATAERYGLAADRARTVSVRPDRALRAGPEARPRRLQRRRGRRGALRAQHPAVPRNAGVRRTRRAVPRALHAAAPSRSVIASGARDDSAAARDLSGSR